MKVIVIGAGMSGLVCSIIAARRGAKVTLMERNNKVGKKIAVTGNGRCNITNENITNENYHSSSTNIFDEIYNVFGKEKTYEFLSSVGIDTTTIEGKVYPISLQAKSVVECLLSECEHLGVKIVYDARVKDITYKGKYKVTVEGVNYYAESLVVATGGKSYADSGTSGDGYDIARNFGHKLIERYPSIVQLKTDFKFNKSLKGFKTNAKVSLIENDKIIRQEAGEILFTDYGLSGPTVLQLSTVLEPSFSKGNKFEILIDYIPFMEEMQLDIYLIERFSKLNYKTLGENLVGFINHRLIPILCKQSNVDINKKCANITKNERKELINVLKKNKINVTGTYLWNQAQVTKGGVDCREISIESLMSIIQPQLYFCGEVLDIDGDCGGYNLQWAISSGATVAKAITS